MPTITGEVLCRFTGNPVQGAIVNLNGYRAYTDSNGRFSITVPEGSYTITVYAPGYDTETLHVEVRADTYLSILLTPIAHTL